MLRVLRSTALKRAPQFSPAAFCTETTTSRPETQVAENLMQIGTRRIFDSEHDMYREMCRRFYQDEVLPYHNQWEVDGMSGREVWRKAGESGMLCVTMPEEYGGAGLDAKFAAINWEEQSYSNGTGPGWALHSEICAPYILHYVSQSRTA
jgi:long-chain-acyl-CoA dehydrogenase